MTAPERIAYAAQAYVNKIAKEVHATKADATAIEIGGLAHGVLAAALEDYMRTHGTESQEDSSTSESASGTEDQPDQV